MAHPKLATIVRRSLLSASAAALMVGPLAAAGAAQTTEGIETLKLTCEEALKTEDAKLIEQFCTAEELEALSPLTKSVDETTSSTTKTVTKAVEDATPEADDGGTPTAGGNTVVPEDGDKSGGGGTKTNTKVGTTGGNARGFDDESARSSGSSGAAGQSEARRKAANGRAAEAPGFGYNADGPFRPGMQSHSSLTLQPFAAPLVSVPPIYELPQVAQQLFGSTSEATAADPQVAGSTATAASPYSATGFSATSADPTGWLAATATGLIMLVGAGHALNGGRKPSRPKA